MASFQSIKDTIGGWLNKFWNLLYYGAQYADEHTTGFEDSLDRIITDCRDFSTAFKDLQHFDFDPKWQTRVINVPRAIQAIEETVFLIRDTLVDGYDQLMQAVITIKTAFHQRPSLATADPSSQSGALTKIIDTVGNMSVAFKALADAFDAVTDVETMIDDVKQKIESLDDLFLPQNKPRKWLTERTYKRI